MSNPVLKQIAHERLQDAVNAFRDMSDKTAAGWKLAHPDFCEAIERSPYLPSGPNLWDRKVEAMKTELSLRTAEYLLHL